MRFIGARYFPFSYAGTERVPPGPLVVAANHFSHLDPVMVSLAVGRPIRYLAVDELYGRSEFFDRLTFWLGAIPMSRSRAPVGALRLALAELAAGGTVGLYPEGMRVWVWGEARPKRGAAWLARRAGVPLLPVAVAGSEEAMGRGTARVSRRPIHVEVGDPLYPADFARVPDPLGSMTAEWARRVAEALQRAYGSSAS
ncbi:MAG: 1-acyl-sn-glycerol-3-phosphate acyltransferase [Acidimicrobiia bacterium]|nr:1-acyl-sn-glycerol-3-phosphate acyltransferase [Acidimicrobiia bacterium]